MISSIQIQNFKGHRDSTIPLGRLTMLVGPNGSGKTSVLEALEVQSELVRQGTSNVLVDDWSPDDLLRRGNNGPMVLTSRARWKDMDWSCEIILKSRSMSVSRRLGNDDVSVNLGEQNPVGRFVKESTQIIGPATLYKLNAERIAAAAYSDQPGAEVVYDGTNTAVALAAIKLGYDEEFARIEESLRRIIPNAERVRIRPAVVPRPYRSPPGRHENVVGSKIYFDFKGATGVPAHAASEGTLFTLALLTILHGPKRPSMLLLDDFAGSLHPEAQMELVRLIKRLLDEYKDLQIVATTHSPYILDELDPSEVHAFALREDGTVATKSLAEHPQAEAMKGAISTGQLWSLDPERRWVLSEPAS